MIYLISGKDPADAKRFAGSVPGISTADGGSETRGTSSAGGGQTPLYISSLCAVGIGPKLRGRIPFHGE